MQKKTLLDKISVYFPQSVWDERPIERLIKLGEKRDRTVNYLVVEAIIEFLDRAEKEEAAKPQR